MLLSEERKALMQIAKDLHTELRAHNERVHLVIGKLIGEADAMKLAALAEAEPEKVVVQKVTFSKAESSTVHPSEVHDAAPKLAAGKRACSNCRKPGHRAKNCPEPDRKALAEAKKKGLKTGKK